MSDRVAICAVAQLKNQPSIWYERVQGMVLECFEALVAETGVGFDMETGVRNVVTCSDDVFDARTISDNAVTDVIGAHFRGEAKVAQDGLNALGYGMASILSGQDDLILVFGHCKESQSESRRMCTNLAFDPFYQRPLGLDYLSACSLQAQAYLERSGVTERQLAEVVVHARAQGAKNPYARENELVSADDVIGSPLMCDPLREAHVYPVTDWAVGMLLASEERAAEFTDRPVWLTGFASSMDSYFIGDRDLASNDGLARAAGKACRMAGVGDPREDFSLVELSDSCAYQLPMWAEGVGLADEGAGGEWLADGGLERHNVNPSGGMLNGNPLILGGLARATEAVIQLRGEAGERQVGDATRALAHGTTGPAGQHHAVLVLER